MKTKSLYVIIAIAIPVLMLVGVSIYMRNFYEPKDILRTAVKESELKNEKYILCQQKIVTGFHWLLIKNEDGEKVYEFINIVGPTPGELKLRYEFEMAQNTFVFYVEEKRMVYSEATKQYEIEYVVTGWDVLYPVKHGDLLLFDLFGSKKYITKKDQWS